jgi:hypothetical protein
LSAIRQASIHQFDDDFEALLRRHGRIELIVGLIGFFERIEYPDPFLHA